MKRRKLEKVLLKTRSYKNTLTIFQLHISIGIASYPKHALDAEGLIKKSDTAMYYSKQSGRNQCNIYNNNMKVFLKDGNKEIDKELLMDSVLALAEAVDAKD